MLHKVLHIQSVSRLLAILACGTILNTPAWAEPQYALSMYGTPALEEGFTHLPYANPEAPTGGRMVTAEVGSFDSLNPYVLKGSVPWQLSYLTSETLMGRSIDEPFTLYGLLAESVETSEARDWVEFTLNPEAKFSNGAPVTVEDVIWSFETLGTEGHPRYAGFWSKVASIEATGERKVRITFNVEDRELALLAGLRPILQKAQWEGLDFGASDGLQTIPVTSGPYIVDKFEAGRFVSLKRNPDYWGKDLPFRKGTMVLDEVRFEYFGNETSAFEAFKIGEVNFTREFNAQRWGSNYDFPRVQSGEVVKAELFHQRPTGMTGLVMNTRLPQFADWRVREAMIQAFNFEFINDTITGQAQPRIESYFGNSPLGMSHGPAEPRVAEFLAPYADDLLPGALEGYAFPVSDGSERNRAGITAAVALLEEAGWTVQDGLLKNAAGEPFAFEILVETGAGEVQSIVDIYVQALSRLGITPTIAAVDSAQYKERTDRYDFGMTYFRRGVSLSPGNEQYLYWGSNTADVTGGRNLMGVQSPAIDAMIGELLNAKSNEDFYAAAQALDRVLTSGRYVIPFYQWNVARIAYDAKLHHPEHHPIFGDWPGWQPEVFWYEE